MKHNVTRNEPGQPPRTYTVSTEYWPKPDPCRDFDWSAIDDNTYDGAPDSSTRNQIGYGRTEQDAIDDLIAQLEEALEDTDTFPGRTISEEW